MLNEFVVEIGDVFKLPLIEDANDGLVVLSDIDLVALRFTSSVVFGKVCLQ